MNQIVKFKNISNKLITSETIKFTNTIYKCISYPFFTNKKSYFNLFDMNMNVFINKHELKNNYLNVLKVIPFNNFKIITEINKGYQILQDDLNRIKHILELNGVHVNSIQFKYIHFSYCFINEFYNQTLFLDELVQHYIETGNQENISKITEKLNVFYNSFMKEINSSIQLKDYYKAAYIYNCLVFIHSIQQKIQTNIKIS